MDTMLVTRMEHGQCLCFPQSTIARDGVTQRAIQWGVVETSVSGVKGGRSQQAYA